MNAMCKCEDCRYWCGSHNRPENERTYLPLRFIAKNLGVSVYRNEASGEVTSVPEK